MRRAAIAFVTLTITAATTVRAQTTEPARPDVPAPAAPFKLLWQSISDPDRKPWLPGTADTFWQPAPDPSRPPMWRLGYKAVLKGPAGFQFSGGLSAPSWRSAAGLHVGRDS